MKIIFKSLFTVCLFALFISTLALLGTAKENTDCCFYTASELYSMVETNGNVSASSITDGDRQVVKIVNDGVTNATGEWVKFNFPTSIELGSDFLIKQYPYMVINYKTDASFTSMSVNAGMKIDTTNEYERCWGLRNYGINSDGQYHKIIYDISSFGGYDGGNAEWSNVLKDSGIEYLRIPVWAHSESLAAADGEYFNIEYVGFFKTLEAAESFIYSGRDSYVYSASTLLQIMEQNGNITTEMIFDGDSTAIRVVNNGIENLTGEYVLFNFFPNYMAESKFNPRFKIKDYPYAVVSYKTNANFGSVSINAGMKIAPDNIYQRCWSLKRNIVTGNNKYGKVIYDLSSFSGYPNGEANWVDVSADSGIKYLRIPIWAHSNNAVNAVGEYFNIEYIGFFKNEADAKAYVYEGDTLKPLGDTDGNGVISSTDSVTLSRYIAGWKGYDDANLNVSSLDLNGDGSITSLDGVLLSRNVARWLDYTDLTVFNPSYMLPWYEKTKDVEEMPDGLIKELDAKFAERVAKIRASKSEYPSSGTIYYVANNGNDTNDGLSPERPFKTLATVESRMSAGTIKTGDVVLLRRGDEWHHQFTITRGITLSAYGEGVKPRIFGSIEADNSSQWILTDSANVYRFNEEMPTTKDVGNIVFNKGECYGMRVIKDANNKTLSVGRDNITSNGINQWEFPVQTFTGYKDLTKIGNNIPEADLMFYHDRENKVLYLYSRNGNPGERFSSVEICRKGHTIRVNSSNVTVDNIMFGFTGSHGLSAGSLHNLTVRNCEIGWIGGSVQNEDIGTRFGNAVEIYGKADGYYVYNNYMYQCFDCGPTIQVSVDLTGTTKEVYHRNVAFYGNALAEASLEIWLSSTPENTATAYSILENCKMYDNYVTMSGYGWKGYNHQKNEWCSFYGAGETCAEFIDCYMENNYFWNLRRHLLKATATNTREGLGFHWRNNVIIKEKDSPLGHMGEDLIESIGFNTYKYDEQTISLMLETGAMGKNSFYYIPEDYEYEVDLKFGLLE